MTAPLLPVKDTTGRTPKMLAGFRGRDIPDGPAEPAPTTALAGFDRVFFSEWRQPANMGPHGDADEDVECAKQIVDARRVSSWGIQSHVVTPGAANSKFVVRHSPVANPQVWTDGPILPIGQADPVIPRQSLLVAIPSSARIKDLLLKLVRRGGNGVITPEMWNAILTATSDVPRPPTGSDDPLPEGGDWGDIIFDANANSSLMKNAYINNDDVNRFYESIASQDLTSSALLLLPKYKTAGFNGSRPCVEWDGSNVLLNLADASVLQGGVWTKYLIVENLDGGDGAGLWVSGGGSFSWGLRADSGNLYAQSNNLFGSYTTIPDDWGMTGAHIYRFVKSSASAHWRVFVDGVMKENIGNAPQSSDGATAQLMDYATGLGLSGRIGRVVEYNAAHDNPTGTGTPADGLTEPELVLQGFWGTP